MRLVDQSAGGFGVLTPIHPVQPGQAERCDLATGPSDDRPPEMLCLYFASSAFEVVVRNVERVPPPDDWPPGDASGLHARGNTPNSAASADHDDGPPCYHVGLKRVRELDPFELTNKSTLSSGLLRPLASVFPRGHSAIGAGLMFSVVIVAGIVAVALLLRPALWSLADGNHRPAAWLGMVSADESAGRSAPPAKRKAEPRAADRAVSQAGKAAAGVTSEVTEAARSAGESARRSAQQAADASVDSLKHLLRSAKDVSIFTSSRVADALELTEQQRAAFKELSKLTRQSLHEINDMPAGASRAERARRREGVQRAAMQHAVELLTPEQRRRWRELAQ